MRARRASRCVDRVAAPACRDEVVVYDFTAGAKGGTVHWKTDKMVEGRRETMYDIDLACDAERSAGRQTDHGEHLADRRDTT